MEARRLCGPSADARFAIATFFFRNGARAPPRSRLLLMGRTVCFIGGPNRFNNCEIMVALQPIQPKASRVDLANLAVFPYHIFYPTLQLAWHSISFHVPRALAIVKALHAFFGEINEQLQRAVSFFTHGQ